MANLKEIRNRIASVSSTMQITSAMKMVSAAKLKKAQDAITAMRPYSDKLTELLKGFTASGDVAQTSPFAEERPVKKVLLVAISSNRGLCGAFNSNIIKEINRLKKEVYADKEVAVVAIGKKAHDVLAKSYSVIQNHSAIYDDLNYDAVASIADQIMQGYAQGEFDKVVLIYNQFKNAATQLVQSEAFLPLATEKSDNAASLDYIFEPSQEKIVKTLIPKALRTQMYKAVRDSFASEHGARMTAMHKATDNATDLRNQLKLTYNKARQAAITNEILEIVGGAEALNN